MAELHWNIGWTLATLGLCWLVLSCAVALAIGQIIQRGKSDSASSAGAQGASPAQAAGEWQDNGWQEDIASLEELPELQTGSRQASGTRLRPVHLADESSEPARKVS